MSTAKTKGVQHLISLSIRRCSAVSDSPGTPRVSSPIKFSSLAPGWVPRGDRDFGMVVTKHPAPHCPLHPVLCSGSVPAPALRVPWTVSMKTRLMVCKKAAGCWEKGVERVGLTGRPTFATIPVPKPLWPQSVNLGRKTGRTSNKDLNYFLNMRFQCP